MRDEYSFENRTTIGKFRLVAWLLPALVLYEFRVYDWLENVIDWTFKEEFGNYKDSAGDEEIR